MTKRNSHPRLERTNPKGESFIGRCPACKIDGLRPEQMKEECFGAPMSQDAALLGAILGDDS